MRDVTSFRTSGIVAVAAILLAAVLSGCVGPMDSNPSDAEGPSGDPPREQSYAGQAAVTLPPGQFRGAGCEGAFLAFFVPADRAQALVPSDFTVAGAPHDSLAWAQVRHATCDRLVVDNATEFPAYSEAQLWIRVIPPDHLEPPEGWYSYFIVKLWQDGLPSDVFAEKGLEAANGAYSQTTTTLVSSVWGVTTGEFEPAAQEEAWTFRILSDDLPVAGVEQYRAFFGDEPPGHYDLVVEGLHSNQDYGGLLVAEEGSTVSSLFGSGGISVEISGIFVGTVLAAEFGEP